MRRLSVFSDRFAPCPCAARRRAAMSEARTDRAHPITPPAPQRYSAEPHLGWNPQGQRGRTGDLCRVSPRCARRRCIPCRARASHRRRGPRADPRRHRPTPQRCFRKEARDPIVMSRKTRSEVSVRVVHPFVHPFGQTGWTDQYSAELHRGLTRYDTTRIICLDVPVHSLRVLTPLGLRSSPAGGDFGQFHIA
jgi:hypothetical protein